MKKLPFLLVLLLFSTNSYAQSTTVFKGIPSVKISVGANYNVTETITSKRAQNLKCVISRIGDSYYWASRENALLVLTESGAFTTFIAVNGSGYIRIITPGFKEIASDMSDTEINYDYAEHLLLGLRSITYYGVAELPMK